MCPVIIYKIMIKTDKMHWKCNTFGSFDCNTKIRAVSECPDYLFAMYCTISCPNTQRVKSAALKMFPNESLSSEHWSVSVVVLNHWIRAKNVCETSFSRSLDKIKLRHNRLNSIFSKFKFWASLFC